MTVLYDPQTLQQVQDPITSDRHAEEIELVIQDMRGQMPDISLQPDTKQPVSVPPPEPNPPQQVQPPPTPAQVHEEPRREPVKGMTPEEWIHASREYRRQNFGGNQSQPQPQAAPSADIQSLQAKVEALTALFQQANNKPQYVPAQEPFGYRAALDPELAQADPELAARLERLSTTFESEIKKVNQSSSEKVSFLENRLREMEAETYQKDWGRTLIGLVPDLQDLMPGTPGGMALAQWANQVPEYARAVNPNTCFEFSPHFVGRIMKEFQSTYRQTPLPSAQTPSLADLANPVLSGASPAVVQPPVQEGPVMSPEQMSRAWHDIQELMKYPRENEQKINELAETYERSRKFYLRQ
jgi:hypothetical protein